MDAEFPKGGHWLLGEKLRENKRLSKHTLDANECLLSALIMIWLNGSSRHSWSGGHPTGLSMTFETLSGLFVAAVTAHNLEEAVWLPAWSRSAGKWHPKVTGFQFRFAVGVLTVLAAMAALLAVHQGKASAGAYVLCGYALAMALNAAFPHLLASLAMRSYMPGTATALLLNLPIAFALIGTALNEGYITLPRFLLTGPIVVIAIVASIPLLFWLGRHLSFG